MSKDLLINCPCESHKIKRFNNVQKEIKPVPKILLIVSKETAGEFKIQCPDMHCRRYNKEQSGGKYNSWYKITLNGLGACSVEPLPKQMFDLEKIPLVVVGED